MEIKEYVAYRKEELRKEIANMDRPPKLVIIKANDNPASASYVKGKLKDAEEVGINAELIELDPSISQEELDQKIEEINADSSVDGFIVQLPLPKHIDEEKVKLEVVPEKDVDGFHPCTKFLPCTPKGIVDYLRNEGFDFKGKNALIIGRSNIVGKPMARILLEKGYDCNVTVIHSKTSEEDKAFYIAHADLIIAAVGKIGVLDDRYSYKTDAVIVDVGINRGEDGKLHGDALPNLPVKLQTPVPGGVGLLTRISLMENLVEAKRK